MTGEIKNKGTAHIFVADMTIQNSLDYAGIGFSISSLENCKVLESRPNRMYNQVHGIWMPKILSGIPQVIFKAKHILCKIPKRREFSIEA